MGNKKKVMKNNEILRISIIFVIIIGFIFLFNIFSKKPAIVGKVVLGGEAVHSENLNMQINESGTYEWQVKNPGSIKSLKATGSVTPNGSAKVYIEKEGKRYLLFDSAKQLFDIDIHVLPEFKKVFQGEEILIQISLLNLRGFGSGNVNVKYSIKDSKGNIIASEEESIFVETQAKFVRKLLIPAEIKPDTYVAFVKVATDGAIIGTGSDTFEVMSKYELKHPKQLRLYLIGIAVLAALAIIFVLAMRALTALKKRQKIAELKGLKPVERLDKLKKELEALGKAYKSKFISEESYRKDKERLQKEIRK